MASYEELRTCSTPEEIKAAAEAAAKWFEETLTDGWKETQKGEVTVFDRPPKNDHHSIKTITDSKLSAEDFWKKFVASGLEQTKKYDKEVIESTVVETVDEHIKVTKSANSAPWPVTAREFVSVVYDYQKDGNYYFVAHSINYPKINVVGKGFVRGVKFFGMKFIPKENGCTIERVLQINPKGMVPNIAINSSKKQDVARLTNMKKYFESN